LSVAKHSSHADGLKITVLPSGVFKSCGQLVELSVCRSFLTTFNSCSNLGQNQALTMLEPGSLMGLVRLVKLSGSASLLFLALMIVSGKYATQA
jgi:hypothetical protein